MKVWAIVGGLLAVAGILLLLNGLTSRFGPVGDPLGQLKRPLPQTGATAAMLPENPDIMGVAEALNAEVINSSSKTLPDKYEDVNTQPAATLAKIEPEAEYRFDDRYKSKLISILAAKDWSQDDFELLAGFLSHPTAEFRPNVLQINTSHVETQAQYSHHLTASAFDMCLEFWEEKGTVVDQAVSGGRVPREVVVAILKVETNFGTYPGKESVFNVFWSLSLGDDPEIWAELLSSNDSDYAEKKKKMSRRARWARGQLKDLLYMARDGHGRNPVEIMGSWAGAFGLAQFIPGSYRDYGRDGDGDGVIDLDNLSDAAASISYYLYKNGWPKDNSLARKRKAVKAYNHSEHYVDCVLAIADSLTALLN